MDITRALRVSAGALDAQGTRLRVIAENLANADSVATTPGGDPYRRRVVTFAAEVDRASGTTGVKIGKVQPAPGDFDRRLDPGHPAADEDGYVLMPNVNALVEMTDLREAQRSYQANLSVIEAAKSMISRTIDLLQG